MATRIRDSAWLKVLFIGNSLTVRNDLPGLVARLAGARGKSLQHRLINAAVRRGQKRSPAEAGPAWGSRPDGSRSAFAGGEAIIRFGPRALQRCELPWGNIAAARTLRPSTTGPGLVRTAPSAPARLWHPPFITATTSLLQWLRRILLRAKRPVVTKSVS